MSLQAAVISTLKDYVFTPLHEKGVWKILVMDNRATELVSRVFRMHHLVEYGICATQSIYRSRERFKRAIYILAPEETELNLLMKDFQPDDPVYLHAHVFFLRECPRDRLLSLTASNAMSYIKKLSQLDIDFIPIESSVYSFESPDTAYLYTLPLIGDQERQLRMMELAERLATVCVTLREYPRICYHKTDSNIQLANLVQTKLDQCLEDNPTMGKGEHKDKSILLILDRGFDPVTPILHELTLQAACYDLLPVEKDMVAYDEEHKCNVTDEDALWREFRHQHIAHVSTTLPNRIRDFAKSKKQFVSAQNLAKTPSGATNEAFISDGGETRSREMDLREMSDLIKGMPQYQAEVAKYSAVSYIVRSCMDIVRQKVADLCQVEQDLVMGQTSKGEPLTDPMRLLSDVFKYDKGTSDDRLRLVILFVLIRDGVAENHLDKLLSVAGVELVNKILFASLSLLLGAQLIIPDSLGISGDFMGKETSETQLSQLNWFRQLPPLSSVANKVQLFLPAKGKRKDRVDSNSFTVSRWSPYLLDIIEDLIAGQIDRNKFEFYHGTRSPPRTSASSLGSSDSLQPKQAPRGPSARFKPGEAAASNNRNHQSDRMPRPPSFRSGMGESGQGTGSEHCGPRLIVCIVGGVTWSEARTGYQVTEKCIETRLAESDRHTVGRRAESSILPGGGGSGWNWEVVVGGTHLLTPESFIGDLAQISRKAMEYIPSNGQAPSHSQTRKSFSLFR